MVQNDHLGGPWAPWGAPLGAHGAQGAKKSQECRPKRSKMTPKKWPKTVQKAYEKTTLKMVASRDHFGGQNAPKMTPKTV